MDPFKDYGGWPTYIEPASFVSALVQRPAEHVDGYQLAVAYMRDERAKRKGK